MVICTRCYEPVDQGSHGLYECPLRSGGVAPTIFPDDIPGGMLIEHGLCHADGTPRRFDSRSSIRAEAAARGLRQWSDVYEESRTRDGRERADWLQSGQAKREKQWRDEARAEQRHTRSREMR